MSSTGSVENSSSLLVLTDKDRSKYLIEAVINAWNNSFQERQHMLVIQKNRKVIIRYETYLIVYYVTSAVSVTFWHGEFSARAQLGR